MVKHFELYILVVKVKIHKFLFPSLELNKPRKIKQKLKFEIWEEVDAKT